jgi:hypothetical protein
VGLIGFEDWSVQGRRSPPKVPEAERRGKRSEEESEAERRGEEAGVGASMRDVIFGKLLVVGNKGRKVGV